MTLGIVAACVAASALALLLVGTRPRAPAPWVLELEVDIDPSAEGGAPTAPLRGGGLALNSMTDPERAQLARLLDDLADQIEQRRNPFVEDLDGRDQRKELDARLRAWGPSFSAAAALGAGSWGSQDGRMTVRPASPCTERSPVRGCFRPGGDVRGIDAAARRRARLFAWPVAQAVVLRAVDPAQTTELATSLRRDLDRSHTTIALALGAGELHSLRPSPELLNVARAASRLMDLAADAGALSGPETDLLVRLARSTTVADDLPWLRLPADSVLVVPRLGALATHDAFVSEVAGRALTSRLRFEWVTRGE